MELAVSVANDQGRGLTMTIAALFLAISMFFVYRSFYGMRIQTGK